MNDTEGKSVLFILLPNGETTTDVFLESEDAEHDPQERVENMLRAVGNDFPGMMHAQANNQRAIDLMTNRRMAAMGFADYDHAAHHAESTTA